MERSEKRNEFLADVIVSAVEGGINYWAHVKNYVAEFKDMGYTRNYASVTVIEDETGKEFHITMDKIDETVAQFNHPVKDLHDDCRKIVVAANILSDAADIDADAADWIFQVACFGKVIYG